MSVFLIELPYVLVPLAMTVISNCTNSIVREYSYAITGGILFIYPIALLFAGHENYLLPPQWIIEHYLGCFLLCTLFLLPLAFLLHMVFNEILLKKDHRVCNEFE
jgi:hypothetical protein